MTDKDKLEVVYPFTKTTKVISWYQRNNPARQRFKNTLEPDSGNFFSQEERELGEPDLIESFAHNPDFSGFSLKDIFAAITIIMDRALKSSPRYEERAFIYRYFTPHLELTLDEQRERNPQKRDTNSWQAIAQKIGASDQTASKFCKRVEDRLTLRFCERGLLNPNKLKELLHFPERNIN